MPDHSTVPISHNIKAKKLSRESRRSRPASEEPANPVRGEVALWQAVLTQALMDAASGSTKPESLQEKAAALRWLKTHDDDFITVCLNANMEPEYAMKKIEAALARNCRWRAEPERPRKPHPATRVPFRNRLRGMVKCWSARSRAKGEEAASAWSSPLPQ